MKPPTAKLTLAVFFLPSSHSLAARGMIHLSRPFRVLIYGDPWQRWPRKASSGAAIPFANGAAAPETKDSRAKDERPQRQGRKTASPGAKDSSTPGTKDSCASKTGRYRPLRRRATAEQMVRRLEGFAFFGEQDQAEGDGEAGDGAEEEFLAVLQGFYCFQEEGLIRLEGLDGI